METEGGFEQRKTEPDNDGWIWAEEEHHKEPLKICF